MYNLNLNYNNLKLIIVSYLTNHSKCQLTRSQFYACDLTESRLSKSVKPGKWDDELVIDTHMTSLTFFHVHQLKMDPTQHIRA